MSIMRSTGRDCWAPRARFAARCRCWATRFFVIYGDSYLPCDYARRAAAFRDSGKLGLMIVYRNEGRWDTSNVEFAGGRILAYDKANRTPAMRYIDYGLGAFQRAAFDDVPADRPAIWPRCTRACCGAANWPRAKSPERFYEIGSRRRVSTNSGSFSNHDVYRTVSGRGRRDPQTDLDVAAVGTPGGDCWPNAARAAAGCSFSAWAAARPTRRTRSTISAKSAAWKPTRPPTSVSELTARTNDEGWAGVFEGWLRVSRLRAADALLVFSVGGGNLEKHVSPNLVAAIEYAKTVGAKITGIVGRDGGYTAQDADACVIVPTVNAEHVTPHAEAFQAVIWHLLVTHPALKQAETKWESVK